MRSNSAPHCSNIFILCHSSMLQLYILSHTSHSFSLTHPLHSLFHRTLCLSLFYFTLLSSSFFLSLMRCCDHPRLSAPSHNIPHLGECSAHAHAAHLTLYSKPSWPELSIPHRGGYILLRSTLCAVQSLLPSVV